MKLMQINDYNEHNKFEESLNKDTDYKENKICINKFIKHKSEKLNIKGIFLINMPEDFKEQKYIMIILIYQFVLQLLI
jgi:hypothetical protein